MSLSRKLFTCIVLTAVRNFSAEGNDVNRMRLFQGDDTKNLGSNENGNNTGRRKRMTRNAQVVLEDEVYFFNAVKEREKKTQNGKTQIRRINSILEDEHFWERNLKQSGFSESKGEEDTPECDKYYNWLFDLYNSCKNPSTVDESCKCTNAEKLYESGEITCAYECPQTCEVCHTCLDLLGC